MNSKEVVRQTICLLEKTTITKGNFPKIKMEGFKNALKNTNMLEAVEQIKKERITKP